MKALRKQGIEIQSVKDFKIGDQIEIIGEYTATCQKVTKKGALFFLDQCLDEGFEMNPTNTNKGGYEASNLRKRLNSKGVLNIFKSLWVWGLMVPFENGDLLRIPCAEELFGCTYRNRNCCCEPSNEKEKEQLPLMKERKNRIASVKNSLSEWYFLQNKEENSLTDFVCVTGYGSGFSISASYSCGVRPVFQIYF